MKEDKLVYNTDKATNEKILLSKIIKIIIIIAQFLF